MSEPTDIRADHARRFQALRELAAYIRANANLPLDPLTVADIIEHQATDTEKAGKPMSVDYKQEIREWFAEHDDYDIEQDDLFIELDSDPEYWQRKAAFDKAVHEMIDAGEFDTYAGRLQFNPPSLPPAPAEPPRGDDDTNPVELPIWDAKDGEL